MGFKLTTLVVIDTDCIGSFKSNYHTIIIPTKTSPRKKERMFHNIFAQVEINSKNFFIS